MTIPEVMPLELKAELEGPDAPVLVDVREADELRISAIPGAKWIPMGQIVARKDELDPKRKTVILCRSGSRSANVTAFLLHSGFSDVRNLATGINGWAKDVDPSMKIY